MFCQSYFCLFFFYEGAKVVKNGILCQKQSPWMSDFHSVCLSHLYVQLVSVFPDRRWSVLNQPRITHVGQIQNNNTILLHTLSARTTARVHRHNSSWSCCQTVLPQLKRQPGPERFVPHRIKHVLGRWNIKAVKSNEATRLPSELCLSDPPPFQIIMSDPQMCPSLEMWLMSHLVSEDLGAGFERRIKGMRLLLGIWAVTGKWVCVMASFGPLRLAMICTWQLSLKTGVVWGKGMDATIPLWRLGKRRDKSCLSVDVKVSNVGTVQQKICPIFTAIWFFSFKWVSTRWSKMRS